LQGIEAVHMIRKGSEGFALGDLTS
jgi:hypothetical protein